ncbi:MAG: OmpA family protein [Bacteroidetes bacterium]|nr:OmpA family protein [Bacteroidota bacterium]
MLNNKQKIISLFGIAVLFINGCKIENEFTKKVDKLLTSKRYKEAIIERDNLCNNNSQLRSDTTTLGQQLRKTQAEYDQLDEKYKTLSTTSGMKLAQMNEDLKNKSKELEKKEKLLQDREQKLKEMQSIISRQDSIVNTLNNIVKNALLGFNSDELSVEMKNGKVYISMSDKLLFKSGSADVEPKGTEVLKKLAEALNKSADVDILIEGHTDNVPIKILQKENCYKDNWGLSVARATSVVRLLTDDYKLDPKRLTASGKGEYFPVASNQTAEGKAKNRRTEIILSPKLDELFKLIQSK